MKVDLTRRGFLGGSVLATAATTLLPKPARAADGEALVVRCTVNGAAREQAIGPDTSAATLIRERLGLTGTKVACGHGACGACTVLVDGEPHVSCLLPATALQGRAVTTVEGLPEPHPVQRAFLAKDALQCGYCTPGFVVEAAAFHDRWRVEHGTAEPPREAVAEALSGHLCRCGAYSAIFAAVQAACTGAFDAGEVVPDRVDALEKVTGRAKYTVDVALPGQLEGRILRSPHGHAILVGLDEAAARAVPGVAAVVRFVPDGGKVMYAGQEVAAVAASDADAAEEAVRRLVAQWDVRQAVVNVEQARAPGAPEVYPVKPGKHRIPSNSEGPVLPAGWDVNVRGPISSSFKGQPGRAEKAVEESTFVVAETYRTANQSHTALEPHATVARWLPDGGLEIHTSTQSCSAVAEDVAQRWNLRHDQVRVLVGYVGGGFGGKAGLQMDGVVAIELARAAKAPVRVALDRTSELIVGGYRPGTEVQVAVASDGTTLEGIQTRAYSDGGVSVGNNTGFALRMIYPDVPKSVKDWDVVSHAPSGRPLRAPGGVQGYFAVEGALDELAVRIGVDPITLRRRFDPSPIRARLYDWIESQPAWRDRSPGTGRYRRGVGVACGAWPCFVQTNAQVQLDAGPEGLVLSSGTQDMGNGTRSTLAHAFADALGIGTGEVGIAIGDSHHVTGPMSAGSRTTVTVAPIVRDLANELSEWLVEVAADQMGLAGATADRGGVRHDGGLVPWKDVLAVAPRRTFVGRRRRDPVGWLLPFSIAETNAIRTTSVSLTMAEVEVDTRLGKVRVREAWAGIGVGKLVAPALARSQIEGAVIQSVGYALYEERRLDPTTGWILTGGLEDYRLCGIGDAPEIHVHFDEEGFEDVHGGGVGLGELPMLAVPPAIANAVHHATGFRPRELPIRPDRVLEGLS